MTAREHRREFRTAHWVSAFVIITFAATSAGTFLLLSRRGPTLTGLGLGMMSIVGLAAIVELVRRRIQLTDDAIHVTEFLGRKTFLARDVDSVKFKRGG